MKTFIVIASLVAAALSSPLADRPCEDAPIDCAAKDAEMDICSDPIDSVAYCPRYCHNCEGPPVDTGCRDFDKLCGTLVNSEYCQKDIARQLCARSCDLCPVPTTTQAPTTTTTTEAPATTTPPRFIEIQDPNCQDIDPDCITLLQNTYCDEDPVVVEQCRRSCNACPTILVPVDGEMTTEAEPEVTTQETEEPEPVTTPVPVVVTTTPGLPILSPFTPAVCFDNDAECAQLVQERDCSSDQILMRLCAVSCAICKQTGTTVSPVTTEAPLDCRDYSDDCGILKPSCAIDPLVRKLCPESCNAAPCAPLATTMEPVPDTTEATQAPTQAPTEAPAETSTEPPTEAPAEPTTEPPTEAPTTAAPVTAAPTTAAPVTDAPTTAAPVTAAPTTAAPMTEAPTTAAPDTDAPTTAAPVTAAPTTGAPVTDSPVTGAVTITLQPQTLENCRDTDSECAGLVQTFFCGTNELIRRICPDSCGLCQVVGTTPSTPDCVDLDPQCGSDLQPFCNRADLLVQRLCRRTCGTCGIDITVPPQVADEFPLTCRTCVDPFCQREVETLTQCPEEAPYCASRIVNNVDGTRGVTKRCATQDQCDKGYAGTAAGSDDLCFNFQANKITQEPFICFFCCVNNECNRHERPDQQTLYYNRTRFEELDMD